MKNFKQFLRSSNELREKWVRDIWEIDESKNPDQWNTFSDGILTAQVRKVDDYGGEGCGDDYWVVFEVTCEGVVTHYKLDGWYASYDGASFDDEFDLWEVEKVEVMKYEWRNVR